MDVDAFVAVRSARWDRLRELIRRRDLTGRDVDELVALYQSTTLDYSRVRTSAPDVTVLSRLSQLLARTRTLLVGAHELSLADVSRFFVVSLPAAFYRVAGFSLGMTALFFLLSLVFGLWTYHTPGALDAMMTPADRRYYAEQAFEAYYSNQPAEDFAGLVWTNNARIAALAIAGGVSGIVPLALLWVNAAAIGQTGAVMAEADALDVFFGLITPHGLLELMSVFVAFGAGFALFWTLVSPGPRTRLQALAIEGRSIVTIVIGLVLTLFVSALIEAWVTPADMPTPVKITIGALALAGYWVYTIVLGRRAVADGETGDMRAELLEDQVAVAV